MRRYLKGARKDLNVVLYLSSDENGICQYPALQSNVVNMAASPKLSIQSSILGRG